MASSKKTEDYDFSSEGFIDLTRNQKLAVINFLSVIAASDVDKQISKIELAFISRYYKEFGVTGDQYLAYISIGGREQTIEEIKKLSKDNFRDLVYATSELCGCNGGLNEYEFMALLNWLEPIGISIEEWNDILENPG